jgi:hypothetical protein
VHSSPSPPTSPLPPPLPAATITISTTHTQGGRLGGHRAGGGAVDFLIASSAPSMASLDNANFLQICRCYAEDDLKVHEAIGDEVGEKVNDPQPSHPSLSLSSCSICNCRQTDQTLLTHFELNEKSLQLKAKACLCSQFCTNRNKMETPAQPALANNFELCNFVFDHQEMS